MPRVTERIEAIVSHLKGRIEKQNHAVSMSPAAADLSKEQIFEMRKRLFCGAQSVSYANSDPLWAVRGEGQYLFDENGASYLDSRNNVGHCGHSHPRVVEAVQQQVGQLNTNSRYLHQNLVRLADMLVTNAQQMQAPMMIYNSRCAPCLLHSPTACASSSTPAVK